MCCFRFTEVCYTLGTLSLFNIYGILPFSLPIMIMIMIMIMIIQYLSLRLLKDKIPPFSLTNDQEEKSSHRQEVRDLA